MNKRLLLFAILAIIQLQAFPLSKLTTADTTKIKKIDVLTDLAYDVLRSDPAQSLEYSQLALSMSRQMGYADGEINALLLSGMVYKNIGAYDKSADALFTALKLAEAENNKVKTSSCLNNIGNIYQAQNNFDKALYYYELSLDIEEQLKNKPQISIRLYNIGALYESADSLDRALTYYYNSLLIEEEIKNEEGILFALYGISGVEVRLKRFENANANISRALSLAHSTNDTSALAICFHELGRLHIAQSFNEKAVFALDSGIYFAQSAGLKTEMMEMYRDIANAYRSLGRNNEAFEYLHQYVLLKDTINSIEITSKVAELEARFQVEQKEEEIQYLKDLNQVKTQKADSEKRNRNFLLVTILMIIILSVFNLQRIAPNTLWIVIIGGLAAAVIILISAVLMLFGADISWAGFFRIFKDVITYSVPALFIAVFVAERFLLKKYLHKASEYTRELQELKPVFSEKTINLQFEGKDAEVSLELKNLLCIEANDNYVALYYLQGNTTRKELFRSTMKMAEDQLADNDEIVRCHKSYIINTSNVHHVSGNAQGYKLHLNGIDFDIPVSRNFPKSMVEKLKKKK